MTRKQRLKLARVLIAFSFVLIFTGLGLELDEKQIIDPITDTHVIASNSTNDISITTTDEVPEINEETPEEGTDASSDEYPTDNQGSNASATSPTTPSQSPNQSNSQTQNNETQQPTTSIETVNNNLRNTIQNNYGITIRYGTETNGYSVAGLSSIMLSDSNRINQLLNELNTNLALYPSGFFRETNQGGYTLTIYLLKRYSQENVTGITDSTTKNIVISLATDYSFVESLHHEIYHYIEKYMYYKGANYTTWNTLNPIGFTYGNTNSNLSYTTRQDQNASFVNNYAQTDEYEDRASTFEYMMASTEASCLITGTTIWKKSKYMCEQIDAVFDTVLPTTTEYWERYVYN